MLFHFIKGMQVATIPPLAQTRRLDFAAAGGGQKPQWGSQFFNTILDV